MGVRMSPEESLKVGLTIHVVSVIRKLWFPGKVGLNRRVYSQEGIEVFEFTLSMYLSGFPLVPFLWPSARYSRTSGNTLCQIISTGCPTRRIPSDGSVLRRRGGY